MGNQFMSHCTVPQPQVIMVKKNAFADVFLH